MTFNDIKAIADQQPYNRLPENGRCVIRNDSGYLNSIGFVVCKSRDDVVAYFEHGNHFEDLQQGRLWIDNANL